MLDLGPLPGGGRGDEAAAFGRPGLPVEDRDQRSALQLRPDQPRAPNGGPDAVYPGLHQHAVEAEARGARQVRCRLALAGAPVRPGGVPSQIVEQGPVVQVGRAIRAACAASRAGLQTGSRSSS